MKTLLYCFYLLVCCGAVEGFTEESVDLGQNVTLKCEVSVKHVYWFLIKPSEPPVYILRSYSSSILVPKYSNLTFSKTFSLQYNSSLFIHNISTNELGVYYCIQTGSPPDISSGIRLYIQNHSAESKNPLCKTDQSLSVGNYALIISVIINAALAVAVTVCHCRRRPKARAQPELGSQLHQDNQDSTMYSEVQLISSNRSIQTNNLNSTYALLKPRNRNLE